MGKKLPDLISASKWLEIHGRETIMHIHRYTRTFSQHVEWDSVANAESVENCTNKSGGFLTHQPFSLRSIPQTKE